MNLGFSLSCMKPTTYSSITLASVTVAPNSVYTLTPDQTVNAYKLSDPSLSLPLITEAYGIHSRSYTFNGQLPALQSFSTYFQPYPN